MVNGQRFDFPGRVTCDFEGNNDLILCDQIKAVDKQRLVKKLGNLDQAAQIELCSCLQEMFEY